MVLAAGAHRGKAHPAVAGDHRGDTVRRGRIQLGIPRDLAVVVGVNVDETGCHDPPGGVDLLAARALDPWRHLHDHAVAHRHVGRAAGRTGAVHHCPVADHKIEHVGLLLSSC